MKFVALLSGGKDSIYSTLQAIQNGRELVCCAHLAPLQHNLEEESYMYQTAGSEAVRMQVEECIGVPFYVREIHGRSKNTSLVYDTTDNDNGVSDEVEDLYLLLQQIQSEHPDVTAVSSGAILSTYQRTRIEHVCARLHLTSLSYLWRMSCQRTILNSILDDGEIDAILVRVACPPGLMPYRHLGKSLRELRDRGVLDQLKERFGMHPAGEGGEYETLVVDCPKLFKYGRLVLEETEIVCDESDDGVGILRITKCSVEKREVTEGGNSRLDSIGGISTSCQSQITEQVQKAKSILSASGADDTSSIPAMSANVSSQMHQSMQLPNVRMMKGGLCHISALLSPTACNQIDDEAQAAVREFLSIRQMLQTILSRLFPSDKPETSPQDILYVHLYLSEISHFSKINQHYQQFFGTQLPPSRSCVAVGKGALPGGRRVMMDCILQRGSGSYLRSDGSNNNVDRDTCDTTFLEKALQNKHHSLRKTLHVQSISHWAPVCIGPYSQANVLRSSLVFMAGMIGLVPQSMSLIQPPAGSSDLSGWEVQLYQSWKNAASVLDGLEDGGGKLEDCLGGLVYVSAGALESLSASSTEKKGSAADNFPWHKLWKTAQCICNDALSTNAGIVMGSVDGVVSENPSTDMDPRLYDEDGVLYGGYEDEETWREMEGPIVEAPSSTSNSDNSCVSLLMVCLPELPAKAEAEVELILASRRAATCLDICNGSIARSVVKSCAEVNSTSQMGTGILWDTGYDQVSPPVTDGNQCTSSCMEICSVARFIGIGCACVSTVIAKWKPSNNGSPMDGDAFNFDVEEILSRMIDSSINNAKGKNELGSLFTIGDVLNVRLYYKAASVSQRGTTDSSTSNASPSVEIEMVDDGSMLRTHLHSVLQLKSKQFHRNTDNDSKGESVNIPAYTVVPVLGMHLSHENETPMEDTGIPLIAMQVTMADMMRMETEIWVRHNRQYSYDN